MANRKSLLSTVRRHGFGVAHNAVNETLVHNFYYWKMAWDTPVRGHLKDNTYTEERLPPAEYRNYWSESTRDHCDVHHLMRQSLDDIALDFLADPVMYASDVSVIMPSSNEEINPHIDTPYRFPPWNNATAGNTLGIQIAIPLQSFETNSGSTAFLPGSHVKHWPIDDCYRGKFNDEFKNNMYQPRVNFGDALVWDTRVLHSHLPNQSKRPRYMLLLNYIEDSIVDDLADYESSLFSE